MLLEMSMKSKYLSECFPEGACPPTLLVLAGFLYRRNVLTLFTPYLAALLLL